MMAWFGKLVAPTNPRDINFFLCWVRHYRPQWFDSVEIEAITVTFQKDGKTSTIWFEDLHGQEFDEAYLRGAAQKIDSAIEYLEAP